MPFTPFHMGFALVAKAAASRYFSIPVFAFTQARIHRRDIAMWVRQGMGGNGKRR